MDMFVAYVLPLNQTTVSQARNQGVERADNPRTSAKGPLSFAGERKVTVLVET